jgi:hypothetical protein
MMDELSTTLGAERDDTFNTLTAALERPLGEGGNGGGNGGGTGDGGDAFDPIRQMLRESFQQLAEQQGAFTRQATEVVTEHVRGLTALVRETAKQAVRGDEAVAKTLSEAVVKSLNRSADIASAVADFGKRIAELEKEIAQLKRAGR